MKKEMKKIYRRLMVLCDLYTEEYENWENDEKWENDLCQELFKTLDEGGVKSLINKTNIIEYILNNVLDKYFWKNWH